MKGKLALLIAIILIDIAPMGDIYILIPAMSEIAKALPGASPTLINLILTISALSVIPASLAAGLLVEKGFLSKKGCLILGFVIFSLAGAAGGLYVNVYYILATRFVLGLGTGLVLGMLVGVTADYFTEKESPLVMGLFTGLGGLLAIGLTVVAGYVTLAGWRYTFGLFLLCLIVPVYHALVLKKDVPAPGASTAEKLGPAQAAGQTARGKASLGRPVFFLVLLTVLSQSLPYTLYLGLSGFVEGEGLGDASATGVANGVLTAAFVLASLLFSPVYGKLKNNTATVFFVLMAAGFLLLARSSSFNMALAALFIWGYGYGLTVPFILQEAIVRPPKELITFTGALVNSCVYLSYSLATFFQPAYSGLFHNDSLRSFFGAMGWSMLGCAAVAVIVALPALNGLKKDAAA